MTGKDKAGLKGVGWGFLVGFIMYSVTGGPTAIAAFLTLVPAVLGGVIGFRKGRESLIVTSNKYCLGCGQKIPHPDNQVFCGHCGKLL